MFNFATELFLSFYRLFSNDTHKGDKRLLKFHFMCVRFGGVVPFAGFYLILSTQIFSIFGICFGIEFSFSTFGCSLK